MSGRLERQFQFSCSIESRVDMQLELNFSILSLINKDLRGGFITLNHGSRSPHLDYLRHVTYCRVRGIDCPKVGFTWIRQL